MASRLRIFKTYETTSAPTITTMPSPSSSTTEIGIGPETGDGAPIVEVWNKLDALDPEAHDRVLAEAARDERVTVLGVPDRPVVCFDETPTQLIGEVRQPIAPEPGQIEIRQPVMSQLPCWKHLSPEAYRKRIADLIEVITEASSAAGCCRARTSRTRWWWRARRSSWRSWRRCSSSRRASARC